MTLDDTLTLLSRLLTSKQLQLEGEFYQNFMEGGRSVAEFCNTEVEPMYKESDHIHIIGKCWSIFTPHSCYLQD